MEVKYELQKISHLTTSSLNFHKEAKGFHSVQPSAETSENLNNDDVLRLHAQLTNDCFDLFDSVLLVEGELHISTDNGVTWAVKGDYATSKITLELNAVAKLFKEMTLYSATDRLIERVQYCGEVSTINQFLMRDCSYPYSEGQIGLFIPDWGSNSDGNAGYANRVKVVGSQFQLMLPLDSVFGFFTFVRTTLSNLNFTLELVRNFTALSSRQNVFWGNVDRDPTKSQFKVHFTKLRWLIPYTRLNTHSKLSYIKQMTKPLYFKFLENRCNYHKVGPGEGYYTYSLGNISSNAHEIVIVFKDPVKAFNKNNSKYIHTLAGEKLTMIKITIGNIDYPAKEFDYQFENNSFAFPYKYFLDLSSKRYGVTPMLSYFDFKEIYSIFVFDLTAQDPAYINLNTPVSVTIKKTENFEPDMYVLLKLEKDVIIDFASSTGSGAKITNLELINIPNKQ